MAAPIDASKGGRKLKFQTVEELSACLNEYFEFCDNRVKEIPSKDGGVTLIKHPAPYTMSGLARRLGISRDTLCNYHNRELFSDTVKAARDRVQEDIENRLMETPNQSGAIFNLKNNFGWKDKTETDLTSGGEKLGIEVEFINGKDSKS